MGNTTQSFNIDNQQLSLDDDNLLTITKANTLQLPLVTSISALQAFSNDITLFDGSTWGKKSGDVQSNGGGFPGTLVRVNSTTYWERITDGYILVEWFGAKADGVTDCTNAFQNAVNVRHSVTPYGWNRNVSGKGNGVYLSGNIIFPSDGTITVKGNGLYGMYIKLRNNENKPLFTVPPGDCVPYFDNLVLDGNKANQTSDTSHGIEYKDAVDSTYRRAGMVNNCNIINFKGDGLHGGQYKQLLRITNTDVRSNDGHGIYQPLYNADWFINSGDFGNNGKSNVYISSQVQIVNASIYNAGDYNIYLGTHTRWSSIIGNIIDHSSKHGIMIEGSNTNPCEVNILGNRFYDNSLSSDNTYSDIFIRNANGVGVVNNSFIAVPGQNTGHVKYLLELESSTKTSFLNNTWRNDSYLTGITNDITVIGNQENDSWLGKTRVTGDLRSTKNISLGESIIGSETGNILNINKLIFGSGDPSQTLGGGRIRSNATNNQLIINYGTQGLVFQNNGSVTGMFMDPSQRMFINTTTTIPSAQLAVFSTNRGFLPPTMTTTQINAISSPADGLTVYNTDLKTICFYDATQWKKVSHSNME